MSDGKIVFSTELDNKGLEKELAGLKKKIQALEDQIETSQKMKMPLVEQSKQLGAELDRAKAKLHEMQTASAGVFSKDQIAEQKENVGVIQQKWNGIQSQVEKYDRGIEKATIELEKNKARAGEVAAQLAKTGPSSQAMADAMEIAQNSAKKFGLRLKEVIRSALVFTLITQSLAKFRDWMGKVIKTNAKASAAVAKLKGALLTLAQPLVDIVIPAFIVLVQIITRVVSAIAQLFAMLTGGTLASTKESAEALQEETDAIDGMSAAAKKAGKSMASFDEINQLSSGGASGGASAGIAPDFNFGEELSESRLQNILALVELIGTAFLTWKISGMLGTSLNSTLGLAVAIYSAIQLIQFAFDAWINGVDWSNMLGMLGSTLGLAAGLYFALGQTAAAIGLIVGGLTMLVTGFRDAYEAGWNLQNVLLSIAGILAIGAGIAILAGSWIPLLIAAIAGLLLAITVGYGQGENLLKGVETLLQGFKDFFVGIFTGDIERAILGTEKIVDGLGLIFFAVIDGIKNMFNSFLDWLDQKTGGKLHGIIEFVRGLFNGLIDGAKEILGNLLDAVKQIFGGIVKFVSGVFTGDWDKAWEGVKDVFKGVWNGIVGFLEGAINIIIRGINWLISQMNKIRFDVPEWVPGIGGKTLGVNIPSIKEVEIPRLATGAVIPPNREFMAVLGDQKRGYNIEAPEDLIRQIVREESGGGMNTGLLQAILEAIKEGKVLTVDRDVFARLVYSSNQAESKRVGVSLTGG